MPISTKYNANVLAYVGVIQFYGWTIYFLLSYKKKMKEEKKLQMTARFLEIN
jgi:hypothetical protein